MGVGTVVVRRQRGASVVEYAFLVTAIGLGVIVGIKALGPRAGRAASAATCMLEQRAAAVSAAGCSGPGCNRCSRDEDKGKTQVLVTGLAP